MNRKKKKSLDDLCQDLRKEEYELRNRTLPGDPAYWMLHDGVISKPTVYDENCYICNDPEFAQMGLPLCYPCYKCNTHVQADEGICKNGHDQQMQQLEDEGCACENKGTCAYCKYCKPCECTPYHSNESGTIEETVCDYCKDKLNKVYEH